MLRTELYRALWNRSFLLAIGLSTFIVGYGFISYNRWPPLHIPGVEDLRNNAYDTWLFAFAGPFGLIAPLLAVLPFADSFVLDRTQGYLRHVLMRTLYWRYLWAKFLANLLAGGLVIALPMLLLFVLTSLSYPRGFAPIEQSRIPFDPLFGPLGHLYRTMPDLYILFRIGLGFVFGAVYATLGLAFATLINNRYLVLATPFLLYNVGNFVLAVLDLAEWTPPVPLIPDHVTTTTSLSVFGELGLIFLSSIICLMLFARRERISI